LTGGGRFDEFENEHRIRPKGQAGGVMR
jgi:hypothetical protein